MRPKQSHLKCTVDGCPLDRYARGWCCNHYQLWRRHGDPEHKTARARQAYVELFWDKVDKNGPIQPHMDTPCWLFTGGLANGYGRVRFEGRAVGAHQVSWYLSNGYWSPLNVLHRCDVRHCVRDSHLFEGTTLENILDCVAKGRRAKTYRPKGYRNLCLTSK